MSGRQLAGGAKADQALAEIAQNVGGLQASRLMGIERLRVGTDAAIEYRRRRLSIVRTSIRRKDEEDDYEQQEPVHFHVLKHT